MPPRKRSSRVAGSTALTGAQAEYVLSRFLKERRISAREVQVHLRSLDQEIDLLEERLRALRAATSGPASTPAARKGRSQPPEAAAKQPVRKRRRQNLSPARRVALKWQGHYLALMRQAPKSQRAGFTAIFKSKGAQAAIKALRKSLGK